MALGERAGQVLFNELSLFTPKHVEGVLGCTLPDILTLTQNAALYAKMLVYVEQCLRPRF